MLSSIFKLGRRNSNDRVKELPKQKVFESSTSTNGISTDPSPDDCQQPSAREKRNSIFSLFTGSKKSTKTNTNDAVNANLDCSLDDSIHGSGFDFTSVGMEVLPNGQIIYAKPNDVDLLGASSSEQILTQPSNEGKQYSSLNQIKIEWSEIEVREENAKAAILGHGSFGTVVRAYWKPKGGIEKLRDRKLVSDDDEFENDEMIVAVKVLTSSISGSEDFNISKVFKQACEEVGMVREAERRMYDSSRIVRPYGVAKGPLTAEMCRVFRIQEGEEGVGIIMRYESGGTLETLVHNPRKTAEPLSIIEKIRILFEIARGLAELHASGIVHADIKLDNVLLSHHRPPKIRLADFGLSIFRQEDENEKLGNSTLKMTSHLRGTPIYCAPELLTNPFESSTEKGKIAQPSRKTDIYAFAIVAWELLSGKVPFGDVRTEVELCTRVHQDIRPPLTDLPADTPNSLIDLIQNLWSKERRGRKTAVEIVAIIQQEYVSITRAEPDIYLYHANFPKLLLSHIYYYFVRCGYRVCNNNGGSDDEVMSLMLRSKIVLICFDKAFQNSPRCLKTVENIRTNTIGKPILTLVVDEKLMGWANERSKEVCQLTVKTTVDIGHIGRAHWDGDDGPDASMLVALNKNLAPLLEIIENVGCHPSTSLMKQRIKDSPLQNNLQSSPAKKINQQQASKILAGLELCIAVYEGDMSYLRGLLESGSPVNAGDYDYRTAAHICCAENMIQAALILFEFKADFTSEKSRDRWGRTPLEEAEFHNHNHLAKIIRALYDAQSELRASKEANTVVVEKQDCVGLELCVAAFQGDETYLRALLESGCPVGAADYDLRTAAHIACSENQEAIVRTLHEFGADFHSSRVKDRFGATPLMEAQRMGHNNLVILVKGLVEERRKIRADAKAASAARKKAAADTTTVTVIPVTQSNTF